MQSLDIISVNLWSILVSLANLALLFWIVKKFLYGPVKKVVEARRSTIDRDYKAAQEAKEEAGALKDSYEEKIANAESEADNIVSLAISDAKKFEKETVEKAKKEAARIIERAEQNAEMERKKAEDSIREEIVSVSAKLSEKILQREINQADHKDLIDRFIDGLGADHE